MADTPQPPQLPEYGDETKWWLNNSRSKDAKCRSSQAYGWGEDYDGDGDDDEDDNNRGDEMARLSSSSSTCLGIACPGPGELHQARFYLSAPNHLDLGYNYLAIKNRLNCLLISILSSKCVLRVTIQRNQQIN